MSSWDLLRTVRQPSVEFPLELANPFTDAAYIRRGHYITIIIGPSKRSTLQGLAIHVVQRTVQEASNTLL